ncbi:MAG TPA: ATP-binding protein [Anaerolineales bacterium]|nr:ATP-binding protein [Anaerolineales bacterium]
MMPENPNNDNPPMELGIFESLVNEQSLPGDQYTIPVNTIQHLKDYVKASEVILVVFEFENSDWAHKKLLGLGADWKSEGVFPIKDSVLCRSLPKDILFIDYSSVPVPELDSLIYDEITVPVKNIILAPLYTDNAVLGTIVFINPVFDPNKKERHKFLQLVVTVLAKTIQAAQHNQQLIIGKADLEATYWQILNSRNTLRTFFDNMPSSVYIVDSSYTIISINNRRSERAGEKPQDLVGKKCYEALCKNSAPCPECRVMDAWNGIPATRTSRELGPNETFVHWEITTVPIRENYNIVNRVIVFEEDVTEKWILEANLIQSEKMASIGQLAANVAHEINNPLAAIIANAQLLLRDLSDADEDIIDSLKLIETAGDRAAKIVSNLLESARREKHYEFEEISLNETISDALSLLRYEINNRSISVKLDLAKEIPDIFANKNQLKGVWINLINNALGAMESKRGKLSISTRYRNKEFYIIISDNGKGILPEHQEHIFEPFFTTKEVGKGTGLGLSVSLQVIKEHHGDISFESTPGKGTKFMITLPVIDPDTY